MTTGINQFGETFTKWEAYKHPSVGDFGHKVRFCHIIKKDGREALYWTLGQSKTYAIFDISLQDALDKYTDDPMPTITEEDFQKWLAAKKQ